MSKSVLLEQGRSKPLETTGGGGGDNFFKYLIVIEKYRVLGPEDSLGRLSNHDGDSNEKVT